MFHQTLFPDDCHGYGSGDTYSHPCIENDSHMLIDAHIAGCGFIFVLFAASISRQLIDVGPVMLVVAMWTLCASIMDHP